MLDLSEPRLMPTEALAAALSRVKSTISDGLRCPQDLNIPPGDRSYVQFYPAHDRFWKGRTPYDPSSLAIEVAGLMATRARDLGFPKAAIKMRGRCDTAVFGRFFAYHDGCPAFMNGSAKVFATDVGIDLTPLSVEVRPQITIAELVDHLPQIPADLTVKPAALVLIHRGADAVRIDWASRQDDEVMFGIDDPGWRRRYAISAGSLLGRGLVVGPQPGQLPAVLIKPPANKFSSQT